MTKDSEELVAWAWDRLVRDGWTPPKAPTSAISEIVAKVIEEARRTGGATARL